MIEELNDAGPASYGFRIPVISEASDPRSLALAVREFAGRTEALLELLESKPQTLSLPSGPCAQAGMATI